MKLQRTLPSIAVAALIGAGGCSFITKLTSAGGADASAFTVDMEKYDVKSIKIRANKGNTGGVLCPGVTVPVAVVAEAVDLKKSEQVTLETAEPKGSADEARGKMDLTEFAFAARGGKVEHGMFATNGDPFAVLLGFDLKTTYRLDKKREATAHFAPTYSCFSAVGVSGASGEYGQSGASGGANGQTPLYDRVGLILLGGVGGGAAQGLTRKAWLPSSQPTKVPSSSSISR